MKKSINSKFCTATAANFESSKIYLLNSVLPLRQISKGIWKLEKRLIQLLLRHGSDIKYSRCAFFTSTKTSHKKALKTPGTVRPADKSTKISYFKAGRPNPVRNCNKLF